MNLSSSIHISTSFHCAQYNVILSTSADGGVVEGFITNAYPARLKALDR